MRKIILIFMLLIFSLFLNIFITCVGNTLDENEYMRTIMHDGIERTYLLRVPIKYDASKPVPLLLVLHGGGGNAMNTKKLTKYGFDKLSESENFILVYPEGVEGSWNDGRGSKEIYAQKENIDDIGFIDKLTDELMKEFNIDKKQVYATGPSNGGIMSNRIACELSYKFTAIAPVIATLAKNLLIECKPEFPVSVISFNGTDDPLVPFQGGDVGFEGNEPRGKVLGAKENIEFWAKKNGCNLKPKIKNMPDNAPNDGTTVKKHDYGTGKDGAKTIMYVIEGGGHTWPNGQQYLPKSMIGLTTRDIDANSLIWEFFKNSKRK